MPGVRSWLVLASVLLAVLAYAALKAPTGPRSLRIFDADRMADLETDMWQSGDAALRCDRAAAPEPSGSGRPIRYHSLCPRSSLTRR